MAPPGSTEAAAPPQADRIAVLAIAYHNIGVEQEFLKRYDQSMLSYRKGVEVAERYLGAKHAICITLKNSIVAAKKAAAQTAAKNKGPRAAGTETPGAATKKGGSSGHAVTGIKKLKNMADARGSPQNQTHNNHDDSMEAAMLSAPLPSAPAPNR